MQLQSKAKKYVEKKLAWVERENQKYYARLAAEERERALSLKEARCPEQRRSLRAQEKRIRNEKIYRMIKDGATNKDIVMATGAPLQCVARLRYESLKK